MSDDDLDARLIDLEVKLSFTEDLVEHLNATVARQQQQIERLLGELLLLRQQLQDQDARMQGPRGAADERPPHY